MANEDATESQSKKNAPLIVTVFGLAVLTLLGGGGGWVVGGMVAPSIKGAAQEEQAREAKVAAKQKEDSEVGLPHISTQANNIVQLEPITSNLAYPSENWVRLEIALLFDGPPDVKLAEDIHQDILAYVRTVSLQQIEGSRGFEYLRDDIQERVDLRAHGRVSKIMFRTFVIE